MTFLLPTCVARRNTACSLPTGKLNIVFFINLFIFYNRKALEQAKRNADLFFPVVGVLEELSKIFSVGTQVD